MIAFWTIVVLATITLIIIWIRLLKMIIPSRSMEVKSNPYTESHELRKFNEGALRKPSIWKRIMHAIFHKKRPRPKKQ